VLAIVGMDIAASVAVPASVLLVEAGPFEVDLLARSAMRSRALCCANVFFRPGNASQASSSSSRMGTRSVTSWRGQHKLMSHCSNLRLYLGRR
jgi:hypothetical protein